jgi:DNA-binding transcriptional ArsR family regulator
MLQHQALDRVFQALSDPSRRAIVDRLSRGDASVSELAQPLAMTLAAVVQHIQLLEACGLIQTRKTGRVRHCHLDRDVLSQAEMWLSQRRTMWEDNLDRLGEVLAQQKARKLAEARAAASAESTKTTPATSRRQRKPT